MGSNPPPPSAPPIITPSPLTPLLPDADAAAVADAADALSLLKGAPAESPETSFMGGGSGEGLAAVVGTDRDGERGDMWLVEEGRKHSNTLQKRPMKRCHEATAYDRTHVYLYVGISTSHVGCEG